MKQFVSLLYFSIIFISCASPKNVAQVAQLYTKIDVFYFEKNIERPYKLLGKKLLNTDWIFSEADLKRAARKKALEYGADAVIIEEQENVYDGTTITTTRTSDSTFDGKIKTNSTVIKPEYKSIYYGVYVKYTGN